MKKIAIALNSLGIISALFLYQSYAIIEPLALSGLFALSLLAILGLANKGLALVLLILSVCCTCGSAVVIGVMLFGDILDSYPLKLPMALTLVSFYIVVIVINILSLKEPAGLNKGQ